MNTKSQIPMDGKTFKECWTIDELIVDDSDDIVVNFINHFMVNIYINGSKVWSVINSIK